VQTKVVTALYELTKRALAIDVPRKKSEVKLLERSICRELIGSQCLDNRIERCPV